MENNYYAKALADYEDARRKAAFQELVARFTGKSAELELLSYHDVRHKLRGIEISRQNLENIPLDSIVGSVGRYQDFTRNFLPRESTNKERWARVMANTTRLVGLPPISVYQIGEVYFVSDGNHRVSVAHQLGNESMEAYVTKVMIDVPITPDIMPDDLIIKAEQVHFLEETNLGKLRPEANLTATKAGAYPTLLEHIEVHRYFMGIDQDQPIPYKEAVAHWYDEVYLPVVKIVRGRGILRSFPGRTETDLYLWIGNHQAGLKNKLGWDVDAESTAVDLESRYASLAERFSKRVMNSFLKIITPDTFVDGPPPGEWRKERSQDSVRKREQLFEDILVAVDLSPNAWNALEQTLIIAGYENSAVHGLHISANVEDENIQTLKAEFTKRCQAAGIERSELTIDEGEVSNSICERSRFTDLTVFPLNHPPGGKPLDRLESKIRSMIQRCPRPVLSVSGAATPLRKALLAYDGSPKSREALYIGAYMVSKWDTSLTVLTSSHGILSTQGTLLEAEAYLEEQYGVRATYLATDIHIADGIRDLATKENFDLILIGGYSAAPMVEVVLGSAVDQVLREVSLPVLICR